jgi:ribosomal small subunit protein bTHX
MGKGDIRSKRGKLKNASFGKSRSRKALKSKNRPQKPVTA